MVVLSITEVQLVQESVQLDRFKKLEYAAKMNEPYLKYSGLLLLLIKETNPGRKPG